MDNSYKRKEKKAALYATIPHLKKIPCHAEFFRYVQWHNLAFDVVETELKIPLHILYYEDYYNNDSFDKAVSGLFSFLRLPVIGKAPEFFRKPVVDDIYEYSDYYTAKERKRATSMMKLLASDRTWTILAKRYNL